jgi:hypothetical protein
VAGPARWLLAPMPAACKPCCTLPGHMHLHYAHQADRSHQQVAPLQQRAAPVQGAQQLLHHDSAGITMCNPCLLPGLQDDNGSDGDRSDEDSDDELAYEMRMEDDLDRAYKDYLERQGGWCSAAPAWTCCTAWGRQHRQVLQCNHLLVCLPAVAVPPALHTSLLRLSLAPLTADPKFVLPLPAGVRDAAEKAKRKRLGDGGELGSDEEEAGDAPDAAALAGYSSGSDEEEQEEEEGAGLVVKLDKSRAGGPGAGWLAGAGWLDVCLVGMAGQLLSCVRRRPWVRHHWCGHVRQQHALPCDGMSDSM